MSYKFGSRSLKELATVKPALQKLAHRALELSPHDFTIVQGIRTVAQSAQNIANGTSFLKDPSKSKHVTGDAIDFAPLKDGKIDWNDLDRFQDVAMAFFKASEELNIPIIWGGWWKGPKDYRETIKRGSYDGGHIELA
ncbi:L-alanyl-D-glutamate peptidase [Serratia phage vB_SmaM-Kamaji]|nr:L-alanyl-D-glutamate peptidase [Serratia phage vB_SmaM-Kamaji]